MDMPKVSNNGLVWWLSIMAGMQSLSAAFINDEVLTHHQSSIFAAVVAALSAGTAVFVAKYKPVADSPQ